MEFSILHILFPYSGMGLIWSQNLKAHFLMVCRIQMTVSLSGTSDDGLQIQNLRPMYIILAKLLSDIPNLEVTYENISLLLYDLILY